MHQFASDQTIGYVNALDDKVFGDDGIFDPSIALSAPRSKEWMASKVMCDINRVQRVYDSRFCTNCGRNFQYDDYKFRYTGIPEELDPSFSGGFLGQPLDVYDNIKEVYHIGGFIPAHVEKLDPKDTWQERDWNKVTNQQLQSLMQPIMGYFDN